jgi:hypothetical protein
MMVEAPPRKEHPMRCTTRQTITVATLSVLALWLALPAASGQELDGVDWVAKFEEKIAQMRDDGIPVSMDEVLESRPEIPDEENSALLFLQAFGMIEEAQKGLLDQEVANLPAAPAGLRRPEPVRAVVSAWLQECGPARALLHYAADLPSGQYPLRLEDNPAAILMPHLAQIRNAARLMAAEAVLCAENRDPAGAADALFVVRRLAASIGDNVFLISALVRIAVDGILVENCERVLGLWPLRDEDLARLSAEIDQELRGLSLSNALTSERTFAYWLYGAPLEDVLAVAGQEEGAIQQAWRSLTYAPRSQWRARDLYHYFQLMDQAIAITRLAERKRLPAADLLEQATAGVPEDYYLTRLIMPAIGRCYTHELEARMALRVARAALAVERWRIDHGGWPDSLDALVPDLLPEVPQDPFSDGTIGYARLTDGVCLYSIGPDGWEDGAPPDGPRTEPYEGWGITFRLLDPELRGMREVLFGEDPGLAYPGLLHAAASTGKIELARLLIEAGWDVNAVDEQWHTPLGVAVEHGHEDVAELLREHGGVE